MVVLKAFTKRAFEICDDTGDISIGELTSLLHDCVAEVTDHSLVGFMAPAQNVSAEFSALSKLRTVDVFMGEGVWIVLDEEGVLVAAVKRGLFKADDQIEKL
eukprot:6547215-Pyramimonas_sp.AAC.1